jgi:hypothetical protein
MEEEKRKFLRFECLIPVDLLEIGDPGMSIQDALIDNVSREGLRLVFDLGQAFQPGDDISFQIQKPEERRTCQVMGEVIWSKPIGEKLEVGLKILKMEKCTKSELLDMGYSAWLRHQEEKEDKAKEEAKAEEGKK